MFHAPWVLLLLLLLPFIGWRMWVSRKTGSVDFSTTSFANSIQPSLRQRLTWVPAALLLAAVALLIVSLAGPREGRQQTISESEGIAMELVIDRSSSMTAMDFKKNDQPIDRLTAIKDVASRFVMGEGELDGRYNDLVGLVTFAGMADGITPPTLDHSFVVLHLKQAQIASTRSEDGTAIGDAIGLAIEKLSALDKNQDAKIKSKIVILLTDGENTAGELDPLQAAELAKMMDIKIYTIGVGTRGRAPIPVTDPFTRRQSIRWTDVNIDEATLQAIADETGGKYFRATDMTSLEKIYDEIDQLEKSLVEEQRYVDYRELAVQPIQYRAATLPPVAMWALILLAAHVVLKHTYFREFV